MPAQNVNGLVTSADGKRRCSWCISNPLYVKYHDTQWGRPVVTDNQLYEKICLEGFQSGLSWLTILRKRESFRRVFHNFDPLLVSKFTQRDVTRLLKDESIIRHRGKIEATIQNAKATLEVQSQYGSLTKFVWSFRLDPKNIARRKAPKSIADIVASTPESEALSKALKAHGFKFVGPTTMYAAMQSLGLVNDHIVGCHLRAMCEHEQRKVAQKLSAHKIVAQVDQPKGSRHGYLAVTQKVGRYWIWTARN